MGSEVFSPMEIDTIGEIMNISLGSSATAVSTMLSRMVTITTPKVEVKNSEDMEITSYEPAVGVEINYTEGLSGNNLMILKRSDVKAIVEVLMCTEMNDEDFELDEMNLSVVCEVMNQMMGASATALSDFLDKRVNISTPEAFEIQDVEAFKERCFGRDQTIVNIYFNLKIEGLIESEFICVFPIDLAKTIVSGFSLGAMEPSEMMETIENINTINDASAMLDEIFPETSQTPVYQEPMTQVQNTHSAAPRMGHSSNVASNPVNVSPIVHRKLEEPKIKLSEEQESNLELIMSVPLEVSVEIGRTRRKVKDILEFTKGSLIELDKLAGENVDVFVNGQCIAKGDVVVIDDCFGVRITEIIKKLEI